MVLTSSSSRRKRAPALVVLAVIAVSGCGQIVVGGDDRLPPDKQALESFAASFRADAPHGPKSSDAWTVPAQTDAPPPVGLFEGPTVDTPISGSVFQPKNAWAGIRGGNYIVVYAGYRDGDPTLGALFMTVRPMLGKVPDPNGLTTELMSSPGATGALRIVSESQGIMTLVGERGTAVTLDLDRRSLVASNP